MKIKTNKVLWRVAPVMLALCSVFVTAGFAGAQAVPSSSVQIVPNMLPDGVVGMPYSQTLVMSALGTSTIGVAPFSWKIGSGALPPGLSLSATGGSSVTISGTPTTVGEGYTFSIVVMDSAYLMGEAQTYTMNIDPSNAVISTMLVSPTMISPTATTATATLIDVLASLESQLLALEQEAAGVSTSVSSVPVACGTATFCRDLTVGDSGTDVLALQRFLNTNGFPIATSGLGSPGNETDYFGTLTAHTLANWQSANNISPAEGYFGPVTQSAIEAQMSASSTSNTSAPMIPASSSSY